ncbi:tetratricopeptide repeat protein [Chitinivorax sp. B]|uniref:tetratricopeptide repeat protein n=1 Tax=Chitinivorax sp. B TaxID=2502235 RepID=UPI0010F76AC7|nr:tetratricopeptide repeat protein [Chitinivorax sp. B]
MSLLLDALRRAEEAKRQQAKLDAEPVADMAETGVAKVTEQKPEPGLPEISFAEIELSPVESIPAEPAPMPLDRQSADEEPLPVRDSATTMADALSLAPVDTTKSGVETTVVGEAMPPPVAEVPPKKPAVAPVSPNPESRLSAASSSPAAPKSSVNPQHQRDTAKRVLSATAPVRPSVNWHLLLVVVGGVAVVAILVWLWWASQPVPSTPTEPDDQNTATVSESMTDPTPAGSFELKPDVPIASVTPPRSADDVGVSSGGKLPASSAPVTHDSTPLMQQVTPKPESVLPAPPAATLSANGAVQITKSVTSDVVPSDVARGYAAFQSRDWGAANRLYQNVLVQEPNNRDALLGMAVLAAHEGRQDASQAYYRQMLVLDPQDVDAQAGLAMVSRKQSGVERIAQLEELLNTQPGNAPLLQELAMAYHNQQRWADAQQLYFRAYTVQPDSPDAAFNLAISLERIDQPRLALRYYQQAASRAQHYPAQFDRALLDRRIATLQARAAPQ